MRLPEPVGPFGHALLCSPALGWSVVGDRIAAAFPVYARGSLDTLLGHLAGATPDSYLEVRSYRGDTKRLTPGDTALGDFRTVP